MGIIRNFGSLGRCLGNWAGDGSWGTEVFPCLGCRSSHNSQAAFLSHIISEVGAYYACSKASAPAPPPSSLTSSHHASHLSFHVQSESEIGRFRLSPRGHPVTWVPGLYSPLAFGLECPEKNP